MKKIIALAMAVMMLLALTVAVGAEGTDADFISAVDAVGNYVVWGGLERKDLIAAANEAYSALSEADQAAEDVAAAKTKLEGFEAKYNTATNNGALVEVSLAGNATVDEAATYSLTTEEKIRNISSFKKEKFVDGAVSKASDSGSDSLNYVAANGALGDFADGQYTFNSDYYFRITLNLENAETISGLRVYARKADGDTAYPPGSAAVEADIEARSADGSTYESKTTAVMAVTDGSYAFTKTQQENTDSSYAYCDFKLDKTISGAQTIIIKIKKLAGSNMHWGAEELRLLKNSADTPVSITELATEGAVAAINKIGSYVVWGGLERKALIDAAQAELDKLSDAQKANISDAVADFETYLANYNTATNNGTVTEVSLAGNATVTEAATYDKNTSPETYKKSIVGGKDRIVDGFVNDKYGKGRVNGNGADTFARGDNAMGSDSKKIDGYYLKITLDLKNAEAFSGVRVYVRKGDNATEYVPGSLSTGAEIEAYKGNSCYKSGKIKPILATNGTITFSLTKVNYADDAYVYYDILLDKRTTDAEKIILKFYDNVNSQNPHWGAEEVRLLNDSTMTGYSIDELATESAVKAINEIGSYAAWGGLERKALIDAAQAELDKLTDEQKTRISVVIAKFDTYRANYNTATDNGALTEVSLAGKAEVAAGTYKKDDGSYVKGINGTKDLLIDGKITDINTRGVQNGNFASADHAMESGKTGKSDPDYCLKIELTLTDPEAFSGIRIYSRKNVGSESINAGNDAIDADVMAYDASGNWYKASTDEVLAITETGIKHTTVTQANTDVNYAFCDYYFGKTFEDVVKVVIIINKLAGNNDHWGAEEIRLLTDTSKEAQSVSDLAKCQVVLGTPTFESGVYEDGTGIIRFYTSFDEVSEFADIESFGTYAIQDGSESFTDESNANENCAVYTVNGTRENDPSRAPAAGEDFSADVTGIASANFDTGVYALSFVKVKGYNNLILSGVLRNAKVNTENKLVKEQ